MKRFRCIATFVVSISIFLILSCAVMSPIESGQETNKNKIFGMAFAQVFTEPLKLTESTTNPLLNFQHPHVDSSEENVYLSLTKEQDGSGDDILFTKSLDGGVSFDNLKQVNNDEDFSFLNDIAIDQDNINNVYSTYTRVTDVSEIVVSKSSDGGVSFGSPINVSSDNARRPAISVNGENVYVVWQDFSVTAPNPLSADIMFATSTDGGLTYSDPLNISNDPQLLSNNPSIATNEDNEIFVVWTESLPNTEDAKVLFTKSTDGGNNFSPPIEIASEEIFEGSVKIQATPAGVAVSGDNIYITFTVIDANNVGKRENMLLISRDQGNTFDYENMINVSNGPGTRSNYASIDASGTNIGISWSERDDLGVNPHWDVFFSGSTDNGITFTNPVNVSGDLDVQYDATLSDISLSDKKAYVTWMTSIFNNQDIYFSSGTLIDNTDSIPPDTLINSAIDGNGNLINLDDETVSTSITFDFTGLDNMDEPSELLFGCNIDGEGFMPCTSPVTYNNLDTGQHTFQVFASDLAGNEDQTPQQFTWTILTLSEGIQKIKDTIDSFNLPTGVTNSLKGPLNEAAEKLTDDNPNNDISTCNKLATFGEHINEELSEGNITEEQAEILSGQALAIMTELGCFSS